MPSTGIQPTARLKRVQAAKQAPGRGKTGETALLWNWYCHYYEEKREMPCPDPLKLSLRALVNLRRIYSLPQCLAIIDCFWTRINPDAYPQLRAGRAVQRMSICLDTMFADHGLFIARRAAMWAEETGRVEGDAGE